MSPLDLIGKIKNVWMLMEGRDNYDIEVEINGKKYRFQKQVPFIDMRNFQNHIIKFKGVLDDQYKTISNISDFWIQLF